ncbi:MAG TPA: hypothetical protein PKM65_00595 [Spirochaetota bacterium]|nr:hypothetical protein [Spirochaetota bacterium]HNT11684.1 hypothetical protein [Spirochaetota bacterium]
MMTVRISTRISSLLTGLSRQWLLAIAVAVIGKVVLLALFSSDYQNQLFIPFVDYFVKHGGNPWQHFYEVNPGVEFPYPPIMLYVLSLFHLPIAFFNVDSIFLRNLLFKLPLLFSDMLISIVLVFLVSKRRSLVFVFYFLSPIIVYATYIHSQLDIIPSALLMTALLLMTKGRILPSAVVFGLALGTKLHILAVLPLAVIYIAQKYGGWRAAAYNAVSICIGFAVMMPYWFSAGYYHLVLANPKQMALFDSVYGIGYLKVYLPYCVCLIIYARFVLYAKINTDLLFAFMGMLFSLLILLIVPSPGWYLWMFPFMIILIIRIYDVDGRIAYFVVTMSIVYLLFFVVAYRPEHHDIIFLSTPLDIKIHDDRFTNMMFTVFEVMILAGIYLLYNFGIRSNAVYRRAFATVIGISGDSGSGKTTLVEDVQALLGDKALMLEGDADHKWERGDQNWEQYTHLHPKANYLHKQADDILMLKSGKRVFRHDYDHETGTFTEKKEIGAVEFVILSGLHTFYLPKNRKLIDLKVFLDTDERLRRHWKIRRDVMERGYTPERVMDQIAHRYPDSEKFVQPQREFADVIVRYFAAEPFEPGSDAQPVVALRVTLDSSIHLESILTSLADEGFNLEWDYSTDLKTQYIVLDRPITRDIIVETAARNVVNIDELIASPPSWRDGFPGFVQLIVLIALSEKMKSYDYSTRDGGYGL